MLGRQFVGSGEHHGIDVHCCILADILSRFDGDASDKYVHDVLAQTLLGQSTAGKSCLPMVLSSSVALVCHSAAIVATARSDVLTRPNGAPFAKGTSL